MKHVTIINTEIFIYDNKNGGGGGGVGWGGIF